MKSIRTNFITKQKVYFSITVFGLLIIIFFGISKLEGKSLASIFKKAFINVYYEHQLSNYISPTSNYDLTANALYAFNSSNSLVTEFNKKAQDIPVLLYHGIVDTPDRFSMTLETFKDQMFALKKAGYHTVKLNDLYDFLVNNKQLPEKSFLLTFDDGRMDSYTKSDPLLKTLGYSAVMFISTNSSIPPKSRKESTYYISVNEIEKMIKSGRWEIGSHAVQSDGGIINITSLNEQANFLSNKKWKDELGRVETDAEYKSRVMHEIADSKSKIETEFDIPVIAFSYPFGDYGQQSQNVSNSKEIINAIVNSNYKMAFRQVWPGNGEFFSNFPKDPNMSLLKRFEVPTNWSGEDLVSFMSIIEGKDISSTRLNSNSDWRNSWGDKKITDNSMILKASATSTGSQVFLGGSRNWQNYLFKVEIYSLGYNNLSLIAQYKDVDNYVSCVFNSERVRIDQKVNGVNKTLISKINPPRFPKEGATLGISTKDSKIDCYLGNESIIEYTLDSTDTTGGIGMQIWNSEVGKAEISIFSSYISEINDDADFKVNLPLYKY